MKGLSRERLEVITTDLLQRNPEHFYELIEMGDSEDNSGGGSPVESNKPQWCKCGRCQPMATEVENKCCKHGLNRCITQTDPFIDLCLNRNVLGVNMRVREDELANLEDRSNANYRHYSYRNYIYWRFGRLGRGQRMVVPSCCVLKIRSNFPSPDGIYRGFIPGENLPA